VFERLTTPLGLFHLGAALGMENTVLEMLGNLEEASPREHLKKQFRHHAQETASRSATSGKPSVLWAKSQTT
jgi:hypothetical protein